MQLAQEAENETRPDLLGPSSGAISNIPRNTDRTVSSDCQERSTASPSALITEKFRGEVEQACRGPVRTHVFPRRRRAARVAAAAQSRGQGGQALGFFSIPLMGHLKLAL